MPSSVHFSRVLINAAASPMLRAVFRVDFIGVYFGTLSLAKRLKSFGSELLFSLHQFLSFFLQKNESLGKHWSG
jgi:hypothetical protein